MSSSNKRSRDDGEEIDEAAQETKISRAERIDEEMRKQEEDPGREILEDDDDYDRINLPTSSSRSSVKKGKECPYLDTISRQASSNA